MGDPAGIGPDICLLAWQNRQRNDVPPFFLVGDLEVMIARASALALDTPVSPISNPSEANGAFPSALPVLNSDVGGPVTVGEPDISAVPAIVSSIERAVRLVIAGDAAAVVTNPVSKAVLYEGGFRYPGHTEFLSALAHGDDDRAAKPVMMLVTSGLRVVPLTIHIPLSDVPSAITRDLIVETARTAIGGLQRYFACETPRLAVAGLNPHAGETGAIGREEIETIAPAVQDLQNAGYAVTGPHSPDALFRPAARQTYDVVLAMYHDQALIPLKTIGFEEGVNVTLGLPFIRTSPDHGTAFAIAGKGRANPQSLIEALRLARTMFENSEAVGHDT